jgi:hypothetical protein
MPDFDTGDIGDCVQWPGRQASDDDTELARAVPARNRRNACRGMRREQGQGTELHKLSSVKWH